ncbi:ATP-binding protein [Aurantibacillus circumpalustris]|uniref:ATP-binding protein n=1 Tax=Aurantibacillus circumpalustris TaxID=3036359 RepID=UPI00295B1658|nr:ATP-binding protein [Aurantibacillus circumpalustris]
MAEGSIIKIGIVGAESSGKTWLCEQLAKYYGTVWVSEYAREYFNDSDIYNYTLEDLVIIAKKQIALEKTLIKKATRFMFCDTTLITLKIWAELEFQTTPVFIEEHVKTIKYDHYFITDNQIPWVKDEQRQNKHSRELLFNMNKVEVEKTGTLFTIISGAEDKRLNQAIQQVSQY